MPRKGRLTAIAADVHEIVRRTAPRAKGVPVEVYPAWDAVVGPQVARVTRPDAFSQGVLTVVAKSSVWIQELVMLREQILAGLEERMGEACIRDVRFRLGRVHERRFAIGRPPAPRHASMIQRNARLC